MPGAPPKIGTHKPESSAIAGLPESLDAWRALIIAFSTKLKPSSIASSMLSFPWGMISTGRLSC